MRTTWPLLGFVAVVLVASRCSTGAGAQCDPTQNPSECSGDTTCEAKTKTCVPKTKCVKDTECHDGFLCLAGNCSRECASTTKAGQPSDALCREDEGYTCQADFTCKKTFTPDAGKADGPSCTLVLGAGCEDTTHCCRQGTCDEVGGGVTKTCCIDVLGAACKGIGTCCDTQGGGYTQCIDDKCCAFYDSPCKKSTDCCPSAPHCNGGRCSPEEPADGGDGGDDADPD